jgi:hypothetical protein
LLDVLNLEAASVRTMILVYQACVIQHQAQTANPHAYFHKRKSMGINVLQPKVAI